MARTAWVRASELPLWSLPLLLLPLSGCVQADVHEGEDERRAHTGWAAADLRVIDPFTYESGPKRPEREPSIAINPTNPLNVIAVTTEEVQQPRYESWLRFFFSDDGGLSWQETRVLDNPERPGAVGDPSLAFDAHGAAYFAYLDAQGVGIDRSTDGGRTWQLVAETATRGRDPATNRCSSPDKQLLAIDRSADILYLVWTRFSHDCSADDIPGHRTVNQILVGDLAMEVVLSRSTDRGQTWTPPELAYDRSGIGAVPVVGPDGELHVAMWGSLPTNTHNTYCASDYGTVVSSGEDQHAAIVIRSSPGGLGPWRTHVQPICDLNIAAAAVAQTGVTTWSAYGFITPAAAIDAKRNRVHVAYVAAPPGSTQSQVWEIHSNPGATSWSTPVIVGGTNDRDGFLPALSSDDRIVHLMYNERTAEGRFSVYYRNSADGGAIWSSPFQLSRSDYGLTGDNIGDYNWLDAYDGRVAAIWTGSAGPGLMQVWSRVGFFAAPDPPP